MATYLVHYNMKKGSQSATNSKLAVADTERSAIEIAKGYGQSQHPDREFILVKVEKKKD